MRCGEKMKIKCPHSFCPSSHRSDEPLCESVSDVSRRLGRIYIRERKYKQETKVRRCEENSSLEEENEEGEEEERRLRRDVKDEEE